MNYYNYFPVFLVVAEQLNFSKAAKQLRIAPSAVSRQIKLLEHNMKVELFIRSPHNVTLTSEGQLLFNNLQTFDSWLHSTFPVFKDKLLRIGCMQNIYESKIGAILEHPKYRKLNIKITIGRGHLLAKQLRSGGIDLVISNVFMDDALITSRRLYQDQLVWVSQQPLSKADLIKERLIVYEPYLKVYKKLNIAIPAHSISVNAFNTTLDLVKRNLGVSIIPKGNYIEEQGLHALEIGGGQEEWIYFSTLNYHTMPPFINDFLEDVIQFDT